RNGKRRRGQQCAGGEFLSVDFLANIGEALRVASVRKRDGHPDYVLESAAGALEGLLGNLEGFAGLNVGVPGERNPAIGHEPDQAGQPYRLPALRDDRGREGVWIHQRRLTPSCGGHAPTAERTVGPARMIAESLTPKPGIREHNRHETIVPTAP